MIDEESGRLEELIEADEVAALDYVDGKMQVEALLAAGMSERERDVLAFSMEGMTTREIGEKLGISHVAVVKCGTGSGKSTNGFGRLTPWRLPNRRNLYL